MTNAMLDGISELPMLLRWCRADLQNATSTQAARELVRKLRAPRHSPLVVLKLILWPCVGHAEAAPAGARDNLSRFRQSFASVRSPDYGM